MGKRLHKLTPRLISFIEKQPLFFVATAMQEGRINVSPKGLDSFRVLSETKIIWLNLTGSGNETATHVRHDDRMTILFCAFEGPPMILRLFGSAKACHVQDTEWPSLISHFPETAGSRQVFVMDLDLVQTSCGFGVPLLAYKGERDQLEAWAKEKGPDGLKAYWEVKNTTSLDGHPTGIFE